MAQVSIMGLNKAAVLAALYNNSKVLGMGILHATGKPMLIEEAQEIIDEGIFSFDYLHGKVMKVDIEGDEFSSWGYDRDNGENTAETVIQRLRETGEISSMKEAGSENDDLFEMLFQMMKN